MSRRGMGLGLAVALGPALGLALAVGLRLALADASGGPTTPRLVHGERST